MESMRSCGVLRALGSHPLALQDTPMPATGNVMDIKEWRAPRSIAALRQSRHYLVLGPSGRKTTIDALESLPPPEETAQVLVVRDGEEEERKRSRRSSISGFLRRLSRSGSSMFRRESE